MTISAAEQYAIELINRARMDPLAEARRYGLTLNEGLVAGTITSTVKQVVAPHSVLEKAAIGHSKWMLANDTFSHTGSGGSQPDARMTAAGYVFSGGWSWGENLALASLTNGVNATNVIALHHKTLMHSAGHRVNILRDSFREVGYSQEIGQYGSYNTSVATENFAHRSDAVYVTGVAYTDRNDNNFYDIGEGRGAIKFGFVGGNSVNTGDAGGYALRSAPKGDVTVQVGAGTRVELSLSSGNVKLDMVDGNTLFTNGTMTLVAGADNARLIGILNKNLVGSGDGNDLIGNSGNNRLKGMGGADDLNGAGGNDTMLGGTGNDTLRGQSGNDQMLGDDGNDKLYGAGGNDRMFGMAGEDRLEGGAGADQLRGLLNADTLMGGAGNDVIDGGLGYDRLAGGGGADDFEFRNGFDHDKIVDFDRGEGDILKFDQGIWSGTKTEDAVVREFASVTADGVLFSFGDGDQLLLVGITSVTGLSGAINFL